MFISSVYLCDGSERCLAGHVIISVNIHVYIPVPHPPPGSFGSQLWEEMEFLPTRHPATTAAAAVIVIFVFVVFVVVASSSFVCPSRTVDDISFFLLVL